MADEVLIKEKDRHHLIRFLRKLAAIKSIFLQHALRYAYSVDMIEFNKNRTLACHYAIGGLILGSDGLIYYCKNSRVIGNCKV